MEIKLICKKCGHDVTKYDVAYVGGYRVIRNGKVDHRFKSQPVPYCPCGAKLEEKQ